MSDQMILFNGYPFLEKEDKEDDDHAYFEPSMWILSELRLFPDIDDSRECNEAGSHSRLRRRHACSSTGGNLAEYRLPGFPRCEKSNGSNGVGLHSQDGIALLAR